MKHRSGDREKKDVLLPEELARCVDRILREKKQQAVFNNKEFHGLTLEEVAEEVSKRLGTKWSVQDLKKAGIK